MTLTNSSRDTDGDTMTWLWEQTAGTAVTLSDATAESPTFTAPERLGRLTFRLTATDEHGARATATVSLDVMHAAGRAGHAHGRRRPRLGHAPVDAGSGERSRDLELVVPVQRRRRHHLVSLESGRRSEHTYTTRW